MLKRVALTTITLAIVGAFGCSGPKEDPGAGQALADFARLVAATESAENTDAHLLQVTNMAEENAARYRSISRDAWEALVIKAYFLAGQYDEVVLQCPAFFKDYPKSSFESEVRLFWAEAAYRSDRYTDSARLFAWLYKNDKVAQPPDWYLFKAAKSLYLAGDFASATASLEELLAENPIGPCSVAAHQLLAAIISFGPDKAGASEHLWKYLLDYRPYMLPENDITPIVGKYLEEYRATAQTDEDILDSYSLYALFCSVHNVQDRMVDAIVDCVEKFFNLSSLPRGCYAAYIYAKYASLVEGGFDNGPIISEWLEKSPDDLKPRFFALSMRSLFNMSEYDKLIEAVSQADPRMSADLEIQIYIATAAFTTMKYDVALKFCRMGLSARPYARELQRICALASIVGTPAPEISGTDALTGKPVNLSDLKGSNVVLEFWGFGTLPMDPEFGFIKSVQRDYEVDGLKFFSVCLELTDTSTHAEQAKEEYASKGATWPLVYVADFAVSPLKDSYPLGSVPLILVIDEKGIVRYIMTRGEELRPAIRLIFGVE